MSRAAIFLALALAACSSASKPDPVAEKCKPHRRLELECADEEGKRALLLIGDMCQKMLNGKNRHVFSPADERSMEAELACAVASKDCPAYAACKQKLDEAGE